MTRDDGEERPGEPAIEVVGKKRGRPRVGPQVSISLPEPYLDKLLALARHHGLTLSEVGRRIVCLGLKRL